MIFTFALFCYSLLLNDNPLKARIERFLGSYVFTGIIIGLFVILNHFIYPIADGLKVHGGGSTADDALLEPMRALLAGRQMYDIYVYSGVKASPGPGWILINAPFTATGLYVCLVPFYVALTTVLFTKLYGSLRAANLILVFLCSSLIFWELLVTGHDSIAMSCSIAMIFMATERWCRDRFGLPAFLIAVLTGIFGTARIIFPFIAPLLAMLIWKRNKSTAVLFVIISTLVTGGLHVYFYLQSEYYHPLILFDRAESNMGFEIALPGAVCTALVGIVAFWKVGTTRMNILFWFIVCLLTPLLFISFGELRAFKGNLALWEGSNFLMPAAVSAVVYVCLSTIADEKKLFVAKEQVST